MCVYAFFFWFAQGSKFFVFSFSTKTFIKLECFLAPKTIILEHGPNNWPNWDQNEFRLATRRNWGRTWRRDEGLGADDSFAMALLKSHHVRHERRSRARRSLILSMSVRLFLSCLSVLSICLSIYLSVCLNNHAVVLDDPLQNNVIKNNWSILQSWIPGCFPLQVAGTKSQSSFL